MLDKHHVNNKKTYIQLHTILSGHDVICSHISFDFSFFDLPPTPLVKFDSLNSIGKRNRKIEILGLNLINPLSNVNFLLSDSHHVLARENMLIPPL